MHRFPGFLKATATAAQTSFVALVLLAFACFLPTSAIADVGETFTTSSGTIADGAIEIGSELTFKVISEPLEETAGTVQVGNGSAAALGKDYAGSIVIPERVEHEGKIYDVIQLASRSFQFCNLSSITIPPTLQRIKSYAFYHCENMATLDYQGTPHIEYIEGFAFYMPNANGVLSAMRFPASLKSVGVYSFAGQSALTELTFEGDSLERIGQYAFENCTGLVEAHVPILTAATSSFGAYCFDNCTNLEFVEFKGDVASIPDELVGTRYFDGCSSLKTVVYRGKKIIPSWKRYGSSADLAYEFTASNPTLYYTISYYPSAIDAQAGTNRLGEVCVRSDIPLRDIVPGMERLDEAGAVVYDGEPVAPPEGADAWYYEGDPIMSDPLADSLYAYPATASDLSSASAWLDISEYPYTGLEVKPQPTVLSAQGTLLTLDVDYALSYEREDADGNWIADGDCTSMGSLRVVISGTGDYHGQKTVPFSIVHAQEGDTFQSDGITYTVIAPTDGTYAGEASVGDGKNPAVSADTEGDLSIPATVQPDGSLVTYNVTAVGNRAFGGDDKELSCAKLEHVTLPEGITSIGTYAFGYCTKLQAISLPASLKTIGSRAFQNCTKLSDLHFEGDYVERLGTYCFAFCTSLSQVELPSVSFVRDNVFANCTRLARVDFLGELAQGDASQFAGCTRLTRVVYHTPRAWCGSFPSNPAIYWVTTFKDATGREIGRAILRDGTPESAVKPNISNEYLLDGNVPTPPGTYGFWRIVKPSSATVTTCCDFLPMGLAVGKTLVGGSGITKASYRVISNDTLTVAYIATKSTKKAKATVPASVQLNGCTYTVTKVGPKAFKGTKVKTVTIKSKAITTFSKAFKSCKVAKVIAPKAKKAAYKKLLTKKKCGRKLKVSWK